MDPYVKCFPDEKIYSLRELMNFTLDIEKDAFSVFSGECLNGYLLAIRDVQLALCKIQIKLNSEFNGLEK